ncbi:L-ornithine N5-oxygenase [Exophiala viscosa]|uniref:L-ornithine N5-oxygenase n=1 Tax=Exophiala viscosa TaxID=2486360 RepID=UPI0021942CC9|nr:L-ornithine N5-oxygenase [Exophiala viscosa]
MALNAEPAIHNVAMHSDSEPLDLVCIGFGVSALAVAIALHERQSLDHTLFLDSQPQSSWKPCPDVPASRLKTSFLNDLITSENPRSEFTFINYLHATNRLVLYCNSGHLTPSREIFSDYLRWCADRLKVRTAFQKQVSSITPVTDATGTVSCWRVLVSDAATGKQNELVTNQVICSMEPQPQIPAILSQANINPNLAHSTDSREAILSTLRKTAGKARIAIVGDGQSAAEVFEYLQSIRGDQQAIWFTQSPVLRRSDSTPFIMDVVRRPTTRAEQLLPPELRLQAVDGVGAPASSNAIDDALLKDLYDLQYQQSVKQANPSKWQYQIKFGHRVEMAQRATDGQAALSLKCLNGDGGYSGLFDLVIAATGYDKNGHERIMRQLSTLIDGHRISVDRDYQVNFRSGLLVEGCGLWLQGSLGDSDDDEALYPILAERSRRIAESIIRQRCRSSEPSPEARTARL